MLIEDFLQRVAHEPARAISRSVSTAPSDLVAKASAPTGMDRTTGGIPVGVPSDSMAASGHQAERDHFHYEHVLGAPASEEAIDAWTRRCGATRRSVARSTNLQSVGPASEIDPSVHRGHAAPPWLVIPQLHTPPAQLHRIPCTGPSARSRPQQRSRTAMAHRSPSCAHGPVGSASTR